MDHAFTVGVEEEFQIVDPTTWELRSHVSELLASSAPAFGDHIKREMHQSIIEVGTKICGSIEELASEIIRTRRDLADAAERVGLRIAAAASTACSTRAAIATRPRFSGRRWAGSSACTRSSATRRYSGAPA
jgi:gamma-glutamyl:cysteine ligase YbdK (ATP-grasp superfamily)